MSVYDKYEIDGISVWMNNCITMNSDQEIKIGFNKILFTGELTVKGIQPIVCVQ